MKLSIIIVHYNTPELLQNCIDSINQTSKGVEYEIVVVDNASQKKIDKSSLNIKLIQNKKNLGFAEANNQGIRVAKGEYILLLNSDTIFKDNILSEMITWLSSHKQVGVVSCGLANEDGSLQRNGGSFPNLLTVFFWMFFIEDVPFISQVLPTYHPKPSSHSRDLDWVTGAFMLMSRDAVEDAGLMPEDYFMYTEDVDYCWQFKEKNWRVSYQPKWRIIHLGGKSSKPGTGLVKEFSTMRIFWRKHYPSWQMPLLRFILRFGAFMRMVLFGILHGKESIKIYAQAFRAS
jgi:GT2 family glycosyltransferase